MKQFFTAIAANLVTVALCVVGGLILLIGIAATAGRSTPTVVRTGSILIIDLEQALSDRPAETERRSFLDDALFAGGENSVPLRSAIQALRTAADDEQISGVLLRGNIAADDYGSGYAALREFRDAITEFRASKKPVHAFLVNPETRDYYVASAASVVTLDPFGSLLLPGLASQQVFLSGLFEKYGIGIQVSRVGRFKAAVEPFTRADMSPENRQQVQSCFVGLSARGLVSSQMVKDMAPNPIIFAMANPEPEIYPSEVHAVRDDAIMATGRSDFPNQVNNVLGFPFIFRGALDVRSRKINMEMKLAAVKALAELAKEEVPEEVKMAYGGEDFKFGKNYLIPKPFDPRVLTRVTPAVAKAAMDSGVARIEIPDLHAYARSLEGRMGNTAGFMKSLRDRLNIYVGKSGKKVRVVFAEGTNTRILQAVKQLIEEDKIEPILLGRKKAIHKKMDMLGLEKYKDDVRTINPRRHVEFENYVRMYSKERQRSGVSIYHAEELMSHQNYFGSMMVKYGLADAVIAGPTLNYADCFPPLMHVLGTQEKKSAAGIFIMSFKNRVLFFADCAVQIEPNEEQLSEIASGTAELFRKLMKREPRIAFLSFSNFGSNDSEKAKLVKRAVKLTKTRYPNLLVEGEMQADVAVNKGLMDKLFSFSTLDGPSDILIFPDLNSANISYKLLAQLGNANAIGPILLPMNHPANIIPRTASVTEIVNMCVLSALLSDKKMSTKE